MNYHGFKHATYKEINTGKYRRLGRANSYILNRSTKYCNEMMTSACNRSAGAVGYTYELTRTTAGPC